MHFHPALGDPEGLHESERGLFESEGFAPAPSGCVTSGQSFTEYLESAPPYPSSPRTRCYWDVTSRSSLSHDFLTSMTAFLEAFFGWPVHIGLRAQTGAPATRHHKTAEHESPQVWSSEVFERMTSTLPDDGYCAVNLTFVDLYPEPSMVFVFSHRALPPANLFAFFRVDTSQHETFPQHSWPACAKTMAHELCHLLGLVHCSFFRCLMNPCPTRSIASAPTLSEALTTTFALCPICLRKLAYACALNVRGRYEKLAGCVDRLGCPADAEWFRSRLSQTPGAFPIEWAP